MATTPVIVDSTKLTDLVFRAFRKVGLNDEDARIAADIVVITDLRGIDSHGVARLYAAYVRGLREGRINAKPNIQVTSHAPATAIVDGDRGLGFIVGYRAMEEAMRRAAQTGAGFVSVRNSTHFGAGGNYSMMALKQDMIGISMTKGGKDIVPPGGRGRGAYINVISIAVPTGLDAPFVLDMATGVVAAGKVEIAQREGKPLPAGWAIDKDGQPLTDPKRFREEGAGLLPLGGSPLTGAYKGWGLTVAVDILTGVLSGTPATTQMAGTHFFGALRVDGFRPAAEFKKSMAEAIRAYHELPKAPGVERILVAGEPEAEIEKRRRAEGIPLNPSVAASLKEMAQALGIEYNL